MTGSSSAKEVFLTVKENFKKIGVIAMGNPMEFATFYNKAQKHDFELMAGAWVSGSGYSDPDQLWSTKNWENQGYNFTGFGDASSDSLIRQIIINIDEEKHLSAHRAFQKRLYDDQPYIFLLSPQKTLVIHKRFENSAGYMESPSILINTLKLKEEYKTKGIN
jgi:peptide/nickel transport system substrate-binding protein